MICTVCGGVFERRPRSRRKTCSVICARRLTWINMTPQGWAAQRRHGFTLGSGNYGRRRRRQSHA